MAVARRLRRVRPNPSLEPGTSTGLALGPRGAAGLCSASRAKHQSASGPSAQTLGRMRTIVLLALVACSSQAPANELQPQVASAAKRFYPNAQWQPSSVVTGNFTCRGQKEHAVLGTSPSEIVVAVFVRGLNSKPELLQYSTSARSPNSAILTVEDLDFDAKEFQEQIGPLPEGLKPSKSCVGLNMSDQMIDSAHIYWNRKARRFEDWVR
jgi:hypothetical protein